MGVFTFTNEYMSTIPPARLFKALVLDSHTLIPKLMPQAIKSIDIIQGDGGAGTIKQINFSEGNQLSRMKNRVDEPNEETFTYKYTMIDLKDKFESIAYEVKFEPTPEGGSKSNMMSTYYTKGDVTLKEEDIKAGKERALGMYKVAEAYLLQNPDAYARDLKCSLE
ncbi:major allergen Pru ar 1-like [Rhodamnia argentea]|uniref:Major allergen Pru ar 1-like n=1 Tax=Rhodamnia argentea TaxID=178133 RepID=A0ABM3H251_9MYRT|nr:major allergen Pru ar 1-like [Rhodamnia argentea]